MHKRSPRLDAEQLRDVLREVASRAEDARQALWWADGDSEAMARTLSLVAIVLTSIGAMADDASGGHVVGNAECWNFGPNFALDASPDFREASEVQRG